MKHTKPEKINLTGLKKYVKMMALLIKWRSKMSQISKEAYSIYGQVYKTWKDATGNASVGWRSYGKNPAEYKLAKKFIRQIWKEVLGTTFPYQFEEVSGNRRSWLRRRGNKTVFVINPSKGWQNLNHAIGHLMAYRKYPRLRPHSAENAWLEVRGAQLVVKDYLNK
jgi:hypothetical protein